MTPSYQTKITASVFGGAADRNISAYTGKLLNDTDLYVALPARIHGPRRKVKVTNHFDRSRSAVASIEDVGPWNTSDAYWLKQTRPQAETGHDMRGRATNHAGIDLSPALARAIGIDGVGHVDWEFIDGQA